jgi:hypothetical protein
LSEQLADPVDDGQAWAQRQEAAFPEWVTRYGGGGPARWDFGLASLDLLSYSILDHCPSKDAIDNPDSAGFAEPASWYLGEIVRRSNPQKLRWSREDHGASAGHYVVQPTAKTQAWDSTDPLAHLGIVAGDGNPLWLRQRFIEYVAPLWNKPWPAWIHSSETGSWSWEEDAQRWYSQRDQWLDNIVGLLGTLAAQLPHITLDYSTASLQAVESFIVDNQEAQDAIVHSAVVAYVGECLLRTGGGRWIWDEHPEHLTNGFPIVTGTTLSASPAHLIEYARVRRNGQTFARIHRAWIAHAAECRQRGDEHALRREPSPGLDPVPEPNVAERWARVRQSRFPDWAARYGAGQQWDFSPESLDALATVILQHCPAGTNLLDAPVTADFIDGVVWYFGETLRRAKPSHWSYSGSLTDRPGRESTGLTISTNLPHDGQPIAVFLVQDINRVVQPTAYLDPSPIDPGALRSSHKWWATSAIRERIEQSQKRREQLKRRSGRKKPDEEVLASWLAARHNGFAEWTAQFAAEAEWNFSIDSLDTLETLVRQRASGPEELLEDKDNADFLEGAAWYLGEALRREDPDRYCWEFERAYHPEPTLRWCFNVETANQLGEVYTKDVGFLRGWYDWGRRLKDRNADE